MRGKVNIYRRPINGLKEYCMKKIVFEYLSFTQRHYCCSYVLLGIDSGFCNTIFHHYHFIRWMSILDIDSKYLADLINRYLNIIATLFQKRKTPWKAILTSKPAWAAFIGHVGTAVAYMFFFAQIPTYLHYILDVNVKSVRIHKTQVFINDSRKSLVRY